MKDELAVALIQTNLYWEDVTANLSSLEEKIAALEKPVDIIVLPEMFNLGFTMNTSLAEHSNMTTSRWMKNTAKQTGALVVGSFAVKEHNNFYNRLFYVFPDGSSVYSDKRHLFRMGEEHAAYTPGEARKIITWKGWNILGLVCYDLRFPVWSRNLTDDPYDLLIYVASWPARRANAWNILLKARAIENLCYVIGVNRVGEDGNGIKYQGDSVAHDFLGEPRLAIGSAEDEKVVTLSNSELRTYRTQFPAYLDADDFVLNEKNITQSL
ncbi:amidohydrolase [Dyadobacter psychrotolerans]|uniref:Omega-amidase YafV n=1 Tax=Dyadobacter psychrotolerans TaxID=2541721 RepID=A0A4R5DP09_9BACT|nr:amidohydrolase [Dyadobacter psychrotolerans]TDE13751.1 amidohydrolase [Dyadobacter psychrotolerans]